MRILGFLFSVFLLSCNGGNQEVSTDLINNTISGAEGATTKQAKITFAEERFEFGTISQGEVVKHDFEISNSGDADLIISNIYGSCGCTVVENWNKNPIKPGEKTTFTAVFSSDAKEGQQTIKLFVVANTIPSQSVTVLAGNVVKPNK